MASFQTIKGFRHFLPEECAIRNYVFERWRLVARAYGFVEYEGPVVESTDLYKKKSGDEITSQLFNFTTKGDEDVSLRPEVTPTLARLVAANQRQFPKPIKWFQIGSCFRYEKPQRGRTREFIQFNVDIAGDTSPAEADAELVAFAIDSLRAFGFTEEDFVIRLSNRGLWNVFLAQQQVAEEHNATFLQIIDKMERNPREWTEQKLAEIGVVYADLEAYLARYLGAEPEDDDVVFGALKKNLQARGLWHFVRIDPSIVRGLAYYTGMVFEAFDLKHNLRAIAGGGRYDNLIELLSDGSVKMAACGFAMGDVVLGELINRNETALQAIKEWTAQHLALDAYIVIADEAQRSQALALLQNLRSHGFRVDMGLAASKLNKQFQAAEQARARFTLVVGSEFPEIGVKNTQSREQSVSSLTTILVDLQNLLSVPQGIRIA